LILASEKLHSRDLKGIRRAVASGDSFIRENGFKGQNPSPKILDSKNSSSKVH